ncbi:hypothetical protein GCM10009767_13650 [Kocuria aegyptia]|uniref:Uncharacterized protein n=1 Tax=Kocuria aegyptia TaxID=330943 RepID=A0ABP4WIN8_9MICC
MLLSARRTILEVDSDIVEDGKYMGAPVQGMNGILVVGNIFKGRVRLGFRYGTSLGNPEHLFNGHLDARQRRSDDGTDARSGDTRFGSPARRIHPRSEDATVQSLVRWWTPSVKAVRLCYTYGPATGHFPRC